MIALARFIMAGPSQAALVAAASAILALLLPPMAWVSGGVVALVVLHLGINKGAQLITLAGLASMLLGWLVLGTPLLAVGIVLLLWLPVWLVAAVLRKTVLLSVSLELTAVMGLLMVLVLQLFIPDTQSELSQGFVEIIQPAIDKQPTEAAKQQLTDAVNIVLALLPGLLATGMVIGTMLSLLLGRWWQAALYNPGGLREEFNQLRLSKTSALVATVILLLAALAGLPLLTMLAMVVLALYLLQGMAVVHGIMDLRQFATGWLFALYVMIFMLPHLVILPLAVFGLTDTWVDIRRRLTTQ
ncbi:MAG: DUF2232 domain-containing protein [Gammaproteobacteria bacterium]|nr:DUF2232 domain-containing protein [Gammaproteobacteria bacterium]